MKSIEELIKQSHKDCNVKRHNKKSEAKESRVLAFSCLHSPYSKEGYFEFICDTYKKYKCNKIVNLGDIADFHSISFHPKDPNLPAAGDELYFIREDLQKWYDKFPKMPCCISNHTSLPYRKAKDAGIPKEMMRDYNEILEAPKGWIWDNQWEIDGVLYMHQGTKGGNTPHLASAIAEMQSTVIGHHHSVLGVDYYANNHTCIFGACAGSGVNRKSLAMSYGSKFAKKPILGCLIIVNGKEVMPVRMEL